MVKIYGMLHLLSFDHSVYVELRVHADRKSYMWRLGGGGGGTAYAEHSADDRW
jgi:hypothetical protein